MKQRVCLLLCSLCLCLSMIASVSGGVTISQIDECMDKKSEGQRRRLSKPGKQLFINFGHSGIEAVQVFGPLALKQITSLDECVRQEAPEHFQSVSESALDEGYDTLFGAYNVTHLTGILPAVLPDIQSRLADVLKKSLHKADWEDSRRHFGVRAAYLLSAEREGLDSHIENKRRLLAEAAPPKDAFVVFPVEHKLKLEQDMQERKRSLQERLSRVLVDRPGTSYTVVAQLTNVADAAGGHIAVHSLPNTVHKDPVREDDDYYEDEAESDANGRALSQAQPQLNENIDELRMDKGSVMVVNGAFHHGLEPVYHGKKQLLALEFWEFKDVSALLPRRATLEEGQALGLARPTFEPEL